MVNKEFKTTLLQHLKEEVWLSLHRYKGLDGTHMRSAAAWKGFEGTPDLVVVYKGG